MKKKSANTINLYKTIGATLRKKRIEQNITLEELGWRSGRDWTYISQIERAKGIPSIETLLLICEQLGIKISELFEVSTVKNKVSDKTEKDPFTTKIAFLSHNAKAKDKKTVLAIAKKFFQK